MSLSKAIRDLQQFRDDFLDGMYPQRSALGPGSLSSTILKSKSITSSMIDVSELAAVAVNTGSLTISGVLTLAGASSRIIDSVGSTWTKDGITIITTATDGGAFGFTHTGGTGYGYLAHNGGTVLGQTAAAYFGMTSGYTLVCGINDASLYPQGTGWNSIAAGFSIDGAAGTFVLKANGTQQTLLLDNSNYAKFYSRIYPGSAAGGAQAVRYIADNGSVLTMSAGLTVTGAVTATAFSGPLTGNVTGSISGGSVSGTSLGTTGLISGGTITASGAVQGATVTSTGLMTAATFRINSSNGGGTNTDVAVPNNTGLDVVLSVDNGATLAFVPLRWVVMNINGTDKKVLTFNE